MENHSQVGKSAFDWDVYKNRKTALQHLKKTCTLIDTILETEDGSAFEFVHSQVMSAFGDKLNAYIQQNGTYVDSYRSTNFRGNKRQVETSLSRANSNCPCDDSNEGDTSTAVVQPTRADELAAAAMAARTQADPQKQQRQQGQSSPPRRSGWSNWPGKVKLVRLPRVNKYTLSVLVNCAYTGYIRTDLVSGGIWQVLDVADYYEMAEVIKACCAFLIKSLTRFNCVYLYHVGAKHKHALQRCAFHKIRANFKHILRDSLARSSTPPIFEQVRGRRSRVQSPLPPAAATNQTAPSSMQQSDMAHDWPMIEDAALLREEIERRNNNLATIKYEHFEGLLVHDKLNVDNEESIWHAIRLWCNYNLEERAVHITNLLTCMRFPRFKTGTEFSARYIWRDPLVLNSKEAQHQLALLDRNHRDLLVSPGQVKVRDGFSLPCAGEPRQLRPRVPHSILLAIGGWQQGQPTTLIESYDVNCNMWFECKKRIMSPLAYHGIECIDGLLYICGGTDGTEILNEVFTFDPIRGECNQKPSMRESRCYVSTACLDNQLYAIGGHNGFQRMKSVERYDLNGEIWTHVRDMNVARSDASACAYNSLIYIAGGLNDHVIESSAEFYNQQDDSWTFLTSMLTPRTSFTLLLHKDTLLAIGGNNGTERLATVEQYSFQTKLWTHHSNMRHRRSTFSAALMDENKLIVVGGYNGSTPFNQVEMFDEDTQQWIMLHKIRFDRSGLKVVVVDDLPNAIDYTFLGSIGA